MRRDPSRPKASDVPLEDLLHAVHDFSNGGRWIVDALPAFPAKVILAKVHKLVSQGLIVDKPFALTPKGRTALWGEK